MSRTLVRAIIIKDDKLLVINRNKFGKEYSTLPGGLVGINENPEQAVIREISEEAMIEIANPKLVFIDHADFDGDQLVYLCEYVSGEPHLREDTQEYAINKLGKNTYTPTWLNIVNLSNTKFLSPELKQAIINALDAGWPESVIEFTSKRSNEF